MDLAKKLYENVMGTAEQNEKAKKEMAEQDAKNPDTTQAKVNRMIEKIKPSEPVKKAKGGSISKAVMQKAGFYDKGKTEKERQKIVSKVTTKPQRIAIVEKAFSTKNMNEGGKVGSASKRADGCAIRGKTRA